jgi:hypothetical protein
MLRAREAASDGSAPTIDESKVYRCQSTALHEATKPLKSWDIRHYLRDLRSGALRASELPKVGFIVVYNRIAGWLGRHEFGKIVGTAKKTPSVALHLRSGELVRVRRKGEVESTLDQRGKNRGLGFGETEMARHFGETFPVLGRVDRMIMEDSGKMRKIDNTVLLQGSACSGLSFRGCARHSHPMWREAWLERVDPRHVGDESAPASSSTQAAKDT